MSGDREKKKPKKKKEKLLLIPGPSGWEIWKGLPGEDLVLALQSDTEEPLAIESLPSGEITMAFPVRDVSAVPFKTPATDEGLVPDLAEMHIERLGLRPASLSGILTDCYQVGSEGEELVLLPVVLVPPEEGSMPKRSPANFDLSPRCLPLPSDAVVLWKEFDHWVFAITKGDKPLHFQALPGGELDEGAGREVRFTLMQLQMQGLLSVADLEGVLWVEEEQALPREEAREAFGRGLGADLNIARKPAPRFAADPCHLLPADIRAERMALKKKRQVTTLAALLVVGYIGLIGWGAFNLLTAQKEAARVEAQANQLTPGVSDIQIHIGKWAELESLVEDDHFPVELYFRVHKVSPKDGLSFGRAEISNQPGENRKIVISGEAETLAQANEFSEKLGRSRELSFYDWNRPPAKETKEKLWRFAYTGTPRNAVPGT